MTSRKLKHIHRFKDRHGKVRHYFRRPGHKRIPLPGLPNSAEYLATYAAALGGAPLEVGASRTVPGSLDALAVAYYQSAGFKQLRASTQRVHHNLLTGLRKEHGGKPVALLKAQHIREMLDDRAATPAAANNVLKLLRKVLGLAIHLGLREDNPTRDVVRLKERVGGHATWSEANIAAFEAHWPSGTRARLALTLLLNTGQRRGDVVLLGKHNITEDGIQLDQQKTGTRVWVPILPELRAELDELPDGQPRFLMTQWGKPFSAAGFTGWFVECARAAGLPAGLTPHGLRKACATRLANNGCSTHEIAAITGHKSIAEVARYTQAANQKALARSAFNFGKNASEG